VRYAAFMEEFSTILQRHVSRGVTGGAHATAAATVMQGG
jgi:hypothetical protein